MPIEVDGEVRGMPEEEFLRIAYAVTGIAFALHKEYGSLFAEKLYKVEFAAECRKLGLQPVETELPIIVSKAHFSEGILRRSAGGRRRVVRTKGPCGPDRRTPGPDAPLPVPDRTAAGQADQPRHGQRAARVRVHDAHAGPTPQPELPDRSPARHRRTEPPLSRIAPRVAWRLGWLSAVAVVLRLR